MRFNSDTMARMLGHDATDAEARRFSEYLISQGWEMVENSAGHMDAWRNGQAMSEQEWQDALSSCFNE